MSPRTALPPALIIATALAPAPGLAQEPWEQGEPLSADPVLLLKAAQAPALRTDKDILDLYECTKIRIDEQGRIRRQMHSVYRIEREAGVEAWSNVSILWKPWHQARPVIRGRVITPDGKAHVLDPATIGEFPVSEGDSKIYDDRRRLGARLPQMGPGVVVEVEILTEDTAPMFPDGTLDWVTLTQPMPLQQVRVELELPEGLPLAHKLFGLPGVRPQRRTSKGRVTLSLDLGPFEAEKEREPYQLPTETPTPALVFATGRSWSTLARGYAALVDQQIGDPKLERLVKETLGGATERSVIIARLLARLHRDIRYTGIEFGEAAIVPRSPQETLKRGFGDCKDKACLLVAMLRTAGIPAQVALLNTGWGRDVDPDLPGMGYFDHAIVHVPGEPALWIDATAEFSQPGELPPMDRGRLALVADPATVGLTRTPELTAPENLQIETREVFLAPLGRGRVMETTTAMGPADASLRYRFGGGDPKKLRENLETYVRKEYGAKSLGRLETGVQRDLTKPFQLLVEAQEVDSAETWQNEARVKLSLWPMLNRLREVVEAGMEEGVPKGGTPKPRRTSLVIPESEAVEWRYRVHVPKGFKARPLLKDDAVKLGPATLTRRFEMAAPDLVVATFHLESGKRVWSAAEVDAARADIKKLGEEDIQFLIFEQVGEAHLLAGRVKEALAEFEALAKAFPKEAGPLTRKARALLAGGLGEAARTEAKRAVALDPKSALAQENLGWVLQHDLIGRRFGKGCDLAGAAEAYRRAKTLDPKEWTHPANLGITFEHFPEGDRYGSGARLAEAAAEYRALREGLKADKMGDNLLACLGFSGKFQETFDFALTLPASELKNTWLIAAQACLKGGDEALRQAKAHIPVEADRRKALISAADIAFRFRKYPAGVVLLNQAAEGMDQPGQVRNRAELFARTRPFEGLSFDRQTPKGLMSWLMVEVLGRDKGLKDLAGVWTQDMRKALEVEQTWKSFRNCLGRGVQEFTRAGLEPKVALDLTLGLMQVAVDGDEARGFKVHINPLTGTDSATGTFYLSRVEGQLQVAACETSLVSFGWEALRRLERKDLEGARQWLDWARDGLSGPNREDPLSGRAFVQLWTKGQEGDAATLRRAATALLCWDKVEARTPDLIRKEIAQAPSAPTRAALQLALVISGLNRERPDLMEEGLTPLLEAYPASPTVMGYRISLLSERKRWSDLLAYAEQWLPRMPDNRGLLGAQSSALLWLGRRAERDALLQARIDKGTGTTQDYNSLAWSHLIQGKVTDRSLELVRRGLQLNNGNLWPVQHTLASLLAEVGQVAEAREFLLKELKGRGIEEPGPNEWYVLGRIAEQLGQEEAAKACYRRLTEAEKGEPPEESCWALAQRRLKGLTRN